MHSQAGGAEKMAERMRELQSRYEMSLAANQPYVLRLDGVAFRNYTDGMVKPFDARLTRAMLLTTRDLMERCAALTAFCQSDEISLVFGPSPSPDQILYAGRVQKIASVMASLAAARFNFYIARSDWTQPPVASHAVRRTERSTAVFDARVFSVPDDVMAMEGTSARARTPHRAALYWRHAYDGRRNAINTIGHCHFAQRELHGLGLAELVERLRAEAGVDVYKSYAPTAVYGAFLKKIQHPHVGFNPLTGTSVPTIRTRIEARSFDWTGTEEQRTRTVFAPLWQASDAASLELIDFDADPVLHDPK